MSLLPFGEVDFYNCINRPRINDMIFEITFDAQFGAEHWCHYSSVIIPLNEMFLFPSNHLPGVTILAFDWLMNFWPRPMSPDVLTSRRQLKQSQRFVYICTLLIIICWMLYSDCYTFLELPVVSPGWYFPFPEFIWKILTHMHLQ